MRLKRYDGNPILIPGEPEWRRCTTFNPAVIIDDGIFYMLERACYSLAPLHSCMGLWRSEDGYHFSLAHPEPVFTAEQMGTPEGTVEDPRLVKYGDWYMMTYVHRNFASSCHPNGHGIPRYTEHPDVPEGDPNHYRSGLARSRDMIAWEDLGLITPREVDDRDCVLFPEPVGGRYAMIRRPMHYVGPEYGCDRPSMWISYSDDLQTWDTPILMAAGENPEWESTKIGAAAQPIRTDAGWLCLYHGVDGDNVYRTGVMLLDLARPERVVARAPDYILEPETYYERVGVIIPRVVFPSANVVKDGTLYVYYGCADTCIGVATCELEELLAYVLQYPRNGG
jgi:predicted GH43/DUF377 family glycosyl hydrolase